MSFGYTTIDGERVEVHVAAAFGRMNNDFQRDTGYRLVVTSGTRTREQQEQLYNCWINRVPGCNLAAKPGYSNHEESGPSGPRAIDIADTGPDWGVSRRGTARDGWMERNAGNYEFENEGYGFNPVEAWHKTFRGVIGGNVPAGGSSIPIDEKVMREQQFLNAARGEALTVDGQYGSATKAAYERYQVFLRDNGYGYNGPIDGIWGDGTQSAHAKFYEVWAATQFPNFPLPAGYYFGPADGPAESISGMYSYQGALTPWQQRMKDRGWQITPDGVYGPETAGVATAFQQEKGYTVDGLIGPQTWNGAWTEPVTPPAGGGSTPPVEEVPSIPANPKTPANPRGLTTYTPYYPGAFIGLDAPLGDGERGTGYEDQREVPNEIQQFHIHRTGTNGDDGDWFSYRNSRSSCPHLHIMSDARVREFIKPQFKPALTGPNWNWRGYGVEIQGAGDGTMEQFEIVADAMAWMASNEGKYFGETFVTYNLRDASLTKTHRQMLPGTECPGDWWQGKVDDGSLLARARVILETKYLAKPPDPDADKVLVEKAWLEQLRANELTNAAEITKQLTKPVG